MASNFWEYKFLRITTNTSDDTDWCGGDPQTLPSATVKLVEPGFGPQASSKPLKVEIVLEWVNADGTVDTTDRGTYSVAGIRVMSRAQTGPTVVPNSSVAADRTMCVVDTPTVTGCIAYRPVIIDEIMPGDEFTVRLTSMTPSSGATRARVLYREIF